MKQGLSKIFGGSKLLRDIHPSNDFNALGRSLGICPALDFNHFGFLTNVIQRRRERTDEKKGSDLFYTKQMFQMLHRASCDHC